MFWMERKRLQVFPASDTVVSKWAAGGFFGGVSVPIYCRVYSACVFCDGSVQGQEDK
jgi:hypothetical protein